MSQTEKQFLQLIANFDSVDEEKMIVKNIVASDGELNRHGETVNPDGWDLKNFKQNPIILINHDYTVQNAVGMAKGVKVVDGKLMLGSVEFSKTNPLAVLTFNLIKEGILKTVSVGYIVTKWGSDEDKYSIMKQELLETSFVVVPANPRAMLTQNQIDALDQLEAATKPVTDAVDAVVAEAGKQAADNFDKAAQQALTEVAPTKTPEEIAAEEQAAAEAKAKEEAADKLKAEEARIQSLIDALAASPAFMDGLTKVIEIKVAEAVKTMVDSNINVESDEDTVEDPKTLALTALVQELRATNQSTGKALRAFNLLTASKPKES
jgi:HK97 family phage prohead protease